MTMQRIETSIYYHPFRIELDDAVLEDCGKALSLYGADEVILLNGVTYNDSSKPTKATLTLSTLPSDSRQSWPGSPRIMRYKIDYLFDTTPESFILLSMELETNHIQLFNNFNQLIHFKKIIDFNKVYWLLNLVDEKNAKHDKFHENTPHRKFSEEEVSRVKNAMNKYHFLSNETVCQTIFPKKFENISIDSYGKVIEIHCLEKYPFCILKMSTAFILISTDQLLEIANQLTQMTGTKFSLDVSQSRNTSTSRSYIDQSGNISTSTAYMSQVMFFNDTTVLTTKNRNKIQNSVYYLPSLLTLNDDSIEANLAFVLDSPLMFFRRPGLPLSPQEQQRLKAEENIELRITQVILEKGREGTRRVVNCYPMEYGEHFEVSFKSRFIEKFSDFGSVLVGNTLNLRKKPFRLVNFIKEMLAPTQDFNKQFLDEAIFFINDHFLLSNKEVYDTIFPKKFENIYPYDFNLILDIISFNGYSFLIMSNTMEIIVISNGQLLALKNYQPNYREDIQKEILVLDHILSNIPYESNDWISIGKNTMKCLQKLLGATPLTDMDKYSVARHLLTDSIFNKEKYNVQLSFHSHIERIYRKYIAKDVNLFLNPEQKEAPVPTMNNM